MEVPVGSSAWRSLPNLHQEPLWWRGCRSEDAKDCFLRGGGRWKILAVKEWGVVWGPERRFLKDGLVIFQPSCDSDHLKEVCVKMDSWALQIYEMIFFEGEAQEAVFPESFYLPLLCSYKPETFTS